MDARYSAAKAAVALTAALALALVAMALFDASWLGFVIIALLFAVLAAREIMTFGARGFLLFVAAMLALAGIGYAVMEIR